jgi:hypothetical protein
MNDYGLWDAVIMARCSPSEKLCLMMIATHAKRDGTGAYPGIRRIAKLTGLARSTVENNMATLIGRGYLSITKRGNQVSSNEYTIRVATLMENSILDAPPLRRGVPISGTGESRPAGQQGVPTRGTGVPTEDRGVSRSAPKAVPMAGTEQKYETPQKQTSADSYSKAASLWTVASGILAKKIPRQTHETWIRPIKPLRLQAGTLTLFLPSKQFSHVPTRPEFDLHGAITKAAALITEQYERLETLCHEEEP